MNQVTLYRELIEIVNESAKVRGVDPMKSCLLLVKATGKIRDILDSYDVEN